MRTTKIWRQIAYPSSARKILQILLVLVLLFFIGLLDYLTGPDFAFSPFYLIPSSLSAWKMSKRMALIISLISSMVWLWVDFSSGRYTPIIPVYILFGHQVGDQVLITISTLVSNSIRQNDVLGQLGGDELAIFLVETDPISARIVVGKLQQTIMEAISKNNWPISLSFGVVSFANTFCKAEEMIKLADQVMYSVKPGAKNNAKYETYPFTDSLTSFRVNEAGNELGIR